MPFECILCKIDFDTELELDVHCLSLSHHIKIEATGVQEHRCEECRFTCRSLADYSKHVDDEQHRKRRDRLRARIDTQDDTTEGPSPSGEAPAKRSRMRTPTSSHRDSNYMEPRFHRNGPGRMTCPSRMGGPPPPSSHPPAHPYPPPPHYPPHPAHYGYSPNGPPNYHRGPMGPYPPRHAPPGPPGYYPPHGRDYGNGPHHWPVDPDAPPFIHNQPEGRFSRNGPDRKSYHGRTDYYENTDERRDERKPVSDDRPRSVRSRPVSPTDQPDGLPQPDAPPPRRNLLERLSMRKKSTDKDKPAVKTSKSKSSSDKKSSDSKGKRTPTPTEKEKIKSRTASPAASRAATPGKVRTKKKVPMAMPLTAMMDKTKKWERVLKGARTKKQSERIQKERQSKFRLMDQTGAIVDESVEEDPHARIPPLQSGSASETSCSSMGAGGAIWGTTPEAWQPAARQLPNGTNQQQQGPSHPPQQSGSLSSVHDSSSIYESMTSSSDMPMSTPLNYGMAMRAYDSHNADMSMVLQEIEQAKRAGAVSASINVDCPPALEKYDSYGSSLALDDVSMSSRMDVTVLPAANPPHGAGRVKEEPVDSPPPESLPNPPQFDASMCPEKRSAAGDSTCGGSTSGDVKLKELWELVSTEEKKKAEILELNKRLRQLESDLTEIQRRKLELMNASPPSL